VLATELELDNSRDGKGAFGSDQRLLACNSVYRHLYDLPDSVTRPGTPHLDIVRHIIQHETGVANRETVASAQQSIARQLAQLAMGKSAAYTHFLADGRVILVNHLPRPGGGWIEVHEDITEKSRAETQILHLQPSLKEFRRRSIVDEELREALARTARGEKFAILFLEFDAFKAVNETFGHTIDGTHLRKALAAHEFELKFQPILSLTTNEIVSSEALIRWQKPGAGLVLPAEFIPLAEQTGLIVPIGEWVLKQACATAKDWPDEVHVAVNVSASQLAQPRFGRSVMDALDESRLAPNRLEVEVSEKALQSDNAATVAALSELRGIGVRIALEDFGAGYSSLGSLQRFPVDIIKIDPSFVRSATSDRQAHEIFGAIALLARGLAATTTVKGIETQEQLDLARETGCDTAQGYFVCPPLPFEGADIGWQPGADAGDVPRAVGAAPVAARLA
jgi:EAL domain-containing protein (putative c-di-GMP-specific phosphodiesterase class I)/GGDEF domain-containing protein